MEYDKIKQLMEDMGNSKLSSIDIETTMSSSSSDALLITVQSFVLSSSTGWLTPETSKQGS